MQKVSYRWHAQNQSGFRQVQTDSQTSFNMFFHVEWSAMSHLKGRGTLGVGGGEVSHFLYFAIHQRINQIEVFGVLYCWQSTNKFQHVHEGSGVPNNSVE